MPLCTTGGQRTTRRSQFSFSTTQEIELRSSGLVVDVFTHGVMCGCGCVCTHNCLILI